MATTSLTPDACTCVALVSDPTRAREMVEFNGARAALDYNHPERVKNRLLHKWNARMRPWLVARLKSGKPLPMKDLTLAADLVRKIPDKDPQCFNPNLKSLSLHLPGCPWHSPLP